MMKSSGSKEDLSSSIVSQFSVHMHVGSDGGGGGGGGRVGCVVT